MAIYHWVEGLGWPDAFLNAAMLLGGMGPVDPLRTTAGKWLAGFYALLASVVFLVLAGVMLAPVIHHVLQRSTSKRTMKIGRDKPEAGPRDTHGPGGEVPCAGNR
jgi:hypothetical protein